jgi:3-hydroxybutyrate dehydrogenase
VAAAWSIAHAFDPTQRGRHEADHLCNTIEDVAQATLFCAAFPSNAMTGQSFIVSHGWFMQ